MSNASTLVKNIVASFGIKGMALAVSFFSTPCYLAFFDDSSGIMVRDYIYIELGAVLRFRAWQWTKE